MRANNISEDVMKTTIKETPGRGIVIQDDSPEPSVRVRQVLIEVAAASQSGTDRELNEWTPAAQAFALEPPVVFGHVGFGTELAAGEGSRRSWPATGSPWRATWSAGAATRAAPEALTPVSRRG